MLFRSTLRMPDLKERKEDILLFANFFLDQANKELDKHLELQLHYSVNLEILKSKIINAGIQGKLTEQLPEEGTAEELDVYKRQISYRKTKGLLAK